MEAAKEKEMIRQYNYRMGGGGGRDGKRGSEGGADEWQGKGGDRSKESREREREKREKFDGNKVLGILARHKEKTGTQVCPFLGRYSSGILYGGPSAASQCQYECLVSSL